MATQSYEKQLKSLRWSILAGSCVVLSQVMMLMNQEKSSTMAWLNFSLIVVCLLMINLSFLALPKAEKKEES